MERTLDELISQTEQLAVQYSEAQQALNTDMTSAMKAIDEAVTAHVLPKLVKYENLFKSILITVGKDNEPPESSDQYVKVDTVLLTSIHIDTYEFATRANNINIDMCLASCKRVTVSANPERREYMADVLLKNEHAKYLTALYDICVVKKCAPILEALDKAVAYFLKHWERQLQNTYEEVSTLLRDMEKVLAKEPDCTTISEDGTVEIVLDGVKYTGTVHKEK